MDNPNLNLLSAARLFLFASRDFWFEVPLPFFLRSPSCEGLGTTPCFDDSLCGDGAVCDLAANVCANLNTGGGCGGLSLDRVIVGAFLGGYIILYGQVQSWTPQLVTGPLRQTPPNKLTEVFWGLINCIPTLVAGCVMQWTDIFDDYQREEMLIFLVVIIILFAIIFAVNSSIHSFLVVNYASKDKVAVSVGFYYMSNAVGRLFGTIGSGLLYTFVGNEVNDFSGNDAVAGLAACFFAGTICSLLAAIITVKIKDEKHGLKCGPCLTLVHGEIEEEEEVDKNAVSDYAEKKEEECTPEDEVEVKA